MAIKRYFYKVYDNEGNYVKTLNDVVDRYPRFSLVINNGPGAMAFNVARGWKEFIDDEDLELYYEIRVFVNDKEDNAKQIYSGYISRRELSIDDKGHEFIKIVCIGYISESTTSIMAIKDAGANYGVTSLQFSTDEPGEILEYAIDSFAEFYSGKITYTAASIEDTGNVTTELFNMNSISEVINVVLSRSPIGWFWFVDGENVIHLKGTNLEEPDHTLLIGKHIKSIKATQDMEDVRNDILVIGGTPDGSEQISRRFTESNSIERYGRRSFIKNDGRLYNTDSIQFLGRYLLGTQYASFSKVEMEVLDSNINENGYDIESINPGDVIRIRYPKKQGSSSKWDIAKWDLNDWDYCNRDVIGEPIIVEEVQYYGTGAKIIASKAVPGVGYRLEDVRRNLENYLNSVAPTNVNAEEEILFTYDADGNLVGTT